VLFPRLKIERGLNVKPRGVKGGKKSNCRLDYQKREALTKTGFAKGYVSRDTRKRKQMNLEGAKQGEEKNMFAVGSRKA